MSKTITIDKSDLSELPELTVNLIHMGRYTLYGIDVKNMPEVVYALRTGVKDIYFLQSNGLPIEVELDMNSVDIKGEVIFDGENPYAFVPNFNWTE
jgi:hypothetical protein